MTTEEQKRKKRKKILKILAALMGVFLLIGCCSIGGLTFLGGKPTTTPTPTATYDWPEPEVVGPTSTPQPTASSTLCPTGTPQPTPVSADNVDARYINELVILLTRYSKVMEDWGEWASSFEEHATYIGWAARAVPILAEMSIVGEEIRDLQPSPRFEISHQMLCEATRHYDAAVYLIAEALDTLNADLIDEAVVELNLGSDLMEEARALLPTPIVTPAPPSATPLPAEAATATLTPVLPTDTPQPAPSPGWWMCSGSTEGAAYVGSVRSDPLKFHKVDCRWAAKISATNRICFADRQAALDLGYRPCKVCNP